MTRSGPARVVIALAACGWAATLCPSKVHADAPAWLHGLSSVALPEHDDKTDAVLLYAEDTLTVQGDGKIKRLSRRAYKILRVGGKGYGVAQVEFDSESKVSNMRGWCIPAREKITK